MIKYFLKLFVRTKVFKVKFKRYYFYHLTNINGNVDNLIPLIKLLMSDYIIMIIESENEIDNNTLSMIEMKKQSVEYDDNYIYSFYGNVDMLLSSYKILSQCMSSCYLINFKNKPSDDLLAHPSYKTLQTEKLYSKKLIDNSISCSFSDKQLFIYIGRENNNNLEKIKETMKLLYR